MLIKLFQRVAGWSQVFARIEFSRLCREYFSNGPGHCQAAVGVNVDFADRAAGSIAQLFFVDANRVFNLSAV